MILERFLLTDRVAVVTGAGRGIGAATAVALAEAGADVVVSSRTASQLGDIAAQIEMIGRRALVVPADLSDLDNVVGLATAAQEVFGRLDVVINNVGGTIPNAFLDTTPEYLEEAFHFNVATAHALCRAAVPLMLKSGGGTVVNISSIMGRGERAGISGVWRGESCARALHAPRRTRPRTAHPCQRHRRRFGGDIGVGIHRAKR